MEIREKKIKNNKYEFVNEYWETYYAWGHKTTILKNGVQQVEHKVRYYNRTWEYYTYQTCMYGALEELKNRELNYYIESYKRAHNIDRFKKGEKQQVLDAFEKTEIGKDLKKLYKAIRDRKFNK